MVGRVEQQPIVAERVENRCGLRGRLGRELADRLLRLGKLVGEEFRQRVVERVGARGRREQQTREERENAQRERDYAAANGLRARLSGIDKEARDRIAGA